MVYQTLSKHRHFFCHCQTCETFIRFNSPPRSPILVLLLLFLLLFYSLAVFKGEPPALATQHKETEKLPSSLLYTLLYHEETKKTNICTFKCTNSSTISSAHTKTHTPVVFTFYCVCVGGPPWLPIPNVTKDSNHTEFEWIHSKTNSAPKETKAYKLVCASKYIYVYHYTHIHKYHSAIRVLREEAHNINIQLPNTSNAQRMKYW